MNNTNTIKTQSKPQNKDYSNIMDLEELQQKYSVLLIKYKQAVTNYVNYANTDKTSMISIPNFAYLGKSSAGETDVNTIQDCEAVCSSNSKCTGATFISGKCNIRTGDSSIISSTSDSYAIIPKNKQLLMNMEDINKQLLELNAKISKKIKTSQPMYDELKKQQYKQNIELMKSYKELEEERENIIYLMNQYETLETSENTNQIRTNQQYYIYILLTLLAIAITFLLIKVSIPAGNNATIHSNTFMYKN